MLRSSNKLVPLPEPCQSRVTKVCCRKCKSINTSQDSSAWGTGQHHGSSRVLLRASEAGETECKEAIAQTDHGGIQNGTVDITVTVPALSKNATVQIFPRQTPIKDTTADLDRVNDTCGGISFHSFGTVSQ